MRLVIITAGVLGCLFFATGTMLAPHGLGRVGIREPRWMKAHGLVQQPSADPKAPGLRGSDSECSEGLLASEPSSLNDPHSTSASLLPPPAASRAPEHDKDRDKDRAPSAREDESTSRIDFARVVASRTQSLAICNRPEGPEGPGMAEVTFSPEGRTTVGLSEPYVNTGVGACVARRLGGGVPPYEGSAVVVRVRFEL